jgi:hypothetical protein
MKNSASSNGVKQEATELKGCQARECVKRGSLRFVIDKAGNRRWTYFLCDEHFILLRDSDKQYIARTEGTKVT